MKSSELLIARRRKNEKKAAKKEKRKYEAKSILDGTISFRKRKNMKKKKKKPERKADRKTALKMFSGDPEKYLLLMERRDSEYLIWVNDVQRVVNKYTLNNKDLFSCVDSILSTPLLTMVTAS